MQKRPLPRAKARDERKIAELLPEAYPDLAAKYRAIVILWREVASHQDRPQSWLLRMIARLSSVWRPAGMAGRREEITPYVRVKTYMGTEPLTREWRDVITEDLENLRRAYYQALSNRYEDRTRLLETPVEEGQAGSVTTWPEYASEDLDKLVRNAKSLQDSVGSAPQMLFHVAEMETLLGRIEEDARATSRKYEARLAASLRDICRIHEPSKFSQEQAECLKGTVTMLVEGWGKITRAKLNYARSRLLDKGLTWLPVTDKAMADLEDARTEAQV